MRFGVCTTITLVILLLIGGCCVEGYIVPQTSNTSASELPPHILRAIQRGYDQQQIMQIELTTFKSRCAESWERYRFHMTDGQVIVLDERGRFARWREGLPLTPPSTSPS